MASRQRHTWSHGGEAGINVAHWGSTALGGFVEVPEVLQAVTELAIGAACGSDSMKTRALSLNTALESLLLIKVLAWHCTVLHYVQARHSDEGLLKAMSHHRVKSRSADPPQAPSVSW
jgi:hypothetical protein